MNSIWRSAATQVSLRACGIASIGAAMVLPFMGQEIVGMQPQEISAGFDMLFGAGILLAGLGSLPSKPPQSDLNKPPAHYDFN